MELRDKFLFCIARALCPCLLRILVRLIVPFSGLVRIFFRVMHKLMRLYIFISVYRLVKPRAGAPL